MRGRDELRARIDKRREKRHKHVGGGRTFLFNFLNTRDLATTTADMPYTFRILGPHDTKCPTGIGFKSFHTIEIQPGTKKEGGVFALVRAKEAWPNPEDAHASVMIDELLDHLDSPRILETLEKDVVNAVNRLEASTEYLLPTIWYGEWGQILVDGKPERKFLPKDPKEVEPTGFIFSFRADTLYDDIDAIAAEDPNLTSYISGRNLKLSHPTKNRYSVRPELTTSAIDPRASNLISDEHYPSIQKMCDKGNLTVEQVEELLASAWWWPYVSPFFNE